jgi:hypothetical protein
MPPPLIDWLGLDIKRPPDAYVCQAPALLDGPAVARMVDQLPAPGVRKTVLQEYRAPEGVTARPPVSAAQ